MKLKIIGGIFISIFFISCSSIPPAAPALSIELGKRISSIEKSNIKLLHRFFDQKRLQIDKFIEDEWVPTFAKNVFSDTVTSEMWNHIVKRGSKEDRLKFLIITGPELQNQINKKRLELIQPLDALQRSIKNAIRQEYTQARSINNSLTSLLISASKVTENKNRYLEMIGINEDKIGKSIDKTDDIVSRLLDKSEDAPKKAEKVITFIQKIKSLRDSI